MVDSSKLNKGDHSASDTSLQMPKAGKKTGSNKIADIGAMSRPRPEPLRNVSRQGSKERPSDASVRKEATPRSQKSGECSSIMEKEEEEKFGRVMSMRLRFEDSEDEDALAREKEAQLDERAVED